MSVDEWSGTVAMLVAGAALVVMIVVMICVGASRPR